ncbi:MAG: hypothetical protein KAI66_06275 [Lentisphaeria bacterium]|nr:hypothetical protein [Lentisphaeria bacterium]
MHVPHRPHPTAGWLAIWLLLCLPLVADDSFPINVYPCPKTNTAPVMDGKLDDAVWKQAPLVSGFILFGKDSLAPAQTSFRLLWDEKNLYLAVHCDEPEMVKLNPVRYVHDDHDVFHGEAIEFFVDPNHTHSIYYQLAFNVAGSLYDGEGEATVWNSEAEVRTHVGDTFWSAEIATPWASLRARPKPGKVVGFNVSRDRNLGGRTYSTWSHLRGGFHDPERFAHLVLSGTPEKIGALSGEFRKGGRTGPITLFSSRGFAQTSYRKLTEAAFSKVEELLVNLRTEARKEKDPAAAAGIRRHVDRLQARVAGLKLQIADKLDAATWTRLDIELQEIARDLHKAVLQARLEALLDSI